MGFMLFMFWHAETLNIFPSQPMHVVEPAPKVRTYTYGIHASASL